MPNEDGHLRLKPITLREASAYVKAYHRHHKPSIGHKFSIGVVDGTSLEGVITVGRPVARNLDNGWTAEATRCCTNGRRNAASMLYGAARRAAKAMGYRLIITYTLASEPGTSLKAAGWQSTPLKMRGEWDCPSRPRQIGLFPAESKIRWESIL